MAESFVIGDRITDVELALNVGCKAILLTPQDLKAELEVKGLLPVCALMTPHWDDIYAFLANTVRTASIERITKETSIRIDLNLDGTGKGSHHHRTGLFRSYAGSDRSPFRL
ncbi:MAG: hypothetical protein MZV63_13250 [Marinilabiliales bacterium]|nr:hypothetical protein [Marinilabiliales bacterium]